MSDFAPDLTEAVIGFRKWNLDGCWLEATHNGVPWSPGVNMAHCSSEFPHIPPMGGGLVWGKSISFNISWGTEPVQPPEVPPDVHKAPHEHCHCGFYAVHSLDALAQALGGTFYPAVGVISAWGDLATYERGFRAQYARVLAVHVADKFAYARESVASLYGVQIAQRIDDLETIAAEHGHAVPESLRPEAAEDSKQEKEEGSIPFKLGKGGFLRYVRHTA